MPEGQRREQTEVAVLKTRIDALQDELRDQDRDIWWGRILAGLALVVSAVSAAASWKAELRALWIWLVGR
jgi:hypothetical protein